MSICKEYGAQESLLSRRDTKCDHGASKKYPNCNPMQAEHLCIDHCHTERGDAFPSALPGSFEYFDLGPVSKNTFGSVGSPFNPLGSGFDVHQ